MKKISLLLVAVLTVGVLFAQKKDRTTAYNMLRKGKLDQALKYIEPTISDPTTMDDPKTWFYRGNIYLQIHMSDNPEYKNLDKDALSKAYESYKKLIEIDEKKTMYNETLQNILVLSEQMFNQGVEKFSSKNYAEAQLSFEKALEVNKNINYVDTLLIFNTALSAENAQHYEDAIKYFNQLIQLNYTQPLIYSSLSSINLKKGDTIQALNEIKKGRDKYPDDFNLLITETNIYLLTKENDKAMANLKEAVKKDPNNPTIQYAVGVNYALMNNFEDAEKAYLKAIELKPDYYEPNYNLGALYVNKASTIIDEANKIPLEETEKFNNLKKEADNYLEKSVPFLEKSLELDPTDRSALFSLKEIYTRLQKMDKLKEINERLAN